MGCIRDEGALVVSAVQYPKRAALHHWHDLSRQVAYARWRWGSRSRSMFRVRIVWGLLIIWACSHPEERGALWDPKAGPEPRDAGPVTSEPSFTPNAREVDCVPDAGVATSLFAPVFSNDTSNRQPFSQLLNCSATDNHNGWLSITCSRVSGDTDIVVTIHARKDIAQEDPEAVVIYTERSRCDGYKNPANVFRELSREQSHVFVDNAADVRFNVDVVLAAIPGREENHSGEGSFNLRGFGVVAESDIRPGPRPDK